MNILRYLRNAQKQGHKAFSKIIVSAFVILIAILAISGIYGFYLAGVDVPVTVLEFEVVGDYANPRIVNATFDREIVEKAQVPNTDAKLYVPGVGVSTYNNMKRVGYSSTQKYTGPGHYRFNIGYLDMPQYNDTLTMAVHFYDDSGTMFYRSQLFTRWRWNESDY